MSKVSLTRASSSNLTCHENRAGSAVVLHKDSPRQERWNRIKETNPVLRKLGELRQAYDESEHPVVSSIRSVTSTIGSFFDENEYALVVRQMRLLDPMFDRESFERELREYIVPEIVDAYLSADRESLKKWCGEGVGGLTQTPAFLHYSDHCDAPPRQLDRLIIYCGPRWNSTSSRA